MTQDAGKTGNTPERTIAESAAEWLIELEDPSTDRLAAFSAWLKASPRHVEEFLLAAAVWRELDGIDPDRRIAIEALIQEAHDNVRPWSSTPLRARVPRPAQRKWRRTALVVSTATALAAIWWLVPGPWSGPSVYTTAKGEQRALKLADGSVVQLNTRSRVEVQFSAEGRDVRLVEGEALFSVAHDAARPFRVVVGDTIVQAVGTQFDVDRRATSTTVSVIDGVVQIASSGAAAPQSIIGPKAPTGTSRDVIESRPVRTKVRLAAGEQATVSAGGHIVTRSSPELVAQVGAWRERRLVFRGDSLDRVADEFNRYNALVIRIEGDGIRNKHLTGVFDADDPESLVLFLAQDSDMTVDRRGEAIVIRSR